MGNAALAGNTNGLTNRKYGFGQDKKIPLFAQRDVDIWKMIF